MYDQVELITFYLFSLRVTQQGIAAESNAAPSTPIPMLWVFQLEGLRSMVADIVPAISPTATYNMVHRRPPIELLSSKML